MLGLVSGEPWVVTLDWRRLDWRMPVCRLTLSASAAAADVAPGVGTGALYVDAPPSPPSPSSLAII